MASAVAAILIAALFVPSSAGAASGVPFSPETVRAVEEAFFDEGRPSAAKLGAYRDFVTTKLRFIEAHVEHGRRASGEKSKAARKKAKDSDTALVLRRILDLLDGIGKAATIDEACAKGAEILTLDFATREYSYPLGSIQYPVWISNLAVDWSAPAHTRARNADREASNLVDPIDGQFLSADALMERISAGEDLSRLQPPGDGVLWRPPGEVSKTDIVSNYFGRGGAATEGISLEFPEDGAAVDFRKLRLTQTKPKMSVQWADAACREKPKKKRKRCRRQYKLKFGGEMHSEPVVNSLLAAIGYSTNVAVNRRGIRVNLGKVTREEIERDWVGYFSEQSMYTYRTLDQVLLPGEQGYGRDEQGEYLVFHDAGMTARPAEMRRIGGWSQGLIDPGAVATGMREARALFLFDVWVANTDLKDAENNRVILRRDPEGEWRTHMIESDLGNSLGLILAEKADAFPWDAVETDWLQRALGSMRGRIELNYFAVQRTGVYKTATYADLRWMARLIGQFTRRQIEDAVDLGRFPESIGLLYVEKLIHRRNQLIEYFGLGDEFPPIPVDRHITTEDGAVVDGKVVRSHFPQETPMEYGRHWASLMEPMAPRLWRQLKRGVAAGIGAIDEIGGDFEVANDLFLTPEILINLQREVLPNPSPQGPFDQFIVQDQATIGLRLGIGNIGAVQGTYFRRYRLAYPAAHEWEGHFAGNQVLNWLLPLDARRNDLPEQYVLLAEEVLGPGVRVRSPDPIKWFVAGGDVSADLFRVRRWIVDRRSDVPMVWVDRGKERKLSGRLWLKMLLLRYSFLELNGFTGSKEGNLYILDPDEIDAGGVSTTAAIETMLAGNGTEQVSEIGAASRRQTQVEYESVEVDFSLIVPKWRRWKREEHIDVSDDAGNPVGHVFQVKHNREFRWKFLDNGETHTSAIHGFLEPPFLSAKSRAEEQVPVVIASFLIDDFNTHSDELDAYYGFIESLGADVPYMAGGFEATAWEQTGRPGGRWGWLLAQARVALRSEALDQLVETDPDAYWDALAVNLGIPRASLDRYGRKPRNRRYGRHRLPYPTGSGSVRKAVSVSHEVLRDLGRAQGAVDPEKRLNLIVHALQLASYRIDGAFNSVVLRSMLQQLDVESLVEQKQLNVVARLGPPRERENKLPESREFVGWMGKKRLGRQANIIVEPFDGVELYTMLDWAKGRGTRVHLAPESVVRPLR